MGTDPHDLIESIRKFFNPSRRTSDKEQQQLGVGRRKLEREERKEQKAQEVACKKLEREQRKQRKVEEVAARKEVASAQRQQRKQQKEEKAASKRLERQCRTPQSDATRSRTYRERQQLASSQHSAFDSATSDSDDVSTSSAEEYPPPADLKPRPWSNQHDIAYAQHFRNCVEDRKPVHVCAVCARYSAHPAQRDDRPDWDVPPARMEEVEVLGNKRFPALDLLRCDGPRSEEAPRHGHTYVVIGGVRYCLEKAGVIMGGYSANVAKLATNVAKCRQSRHATAQMSQMSQMSPNGAIDSMWK